MAQSDPVELEVSKLLLLHARKYIIGVIIRYFEPFFHPQTKLV